MSYTHQRMLIWIGIVLAIIYAVGYAGLMGFFPPPPPGLPTEQVVALYSHNNLQLRVGAVMMVFAGAFSLPWAAVISIQMARVEKKGLPIWAVVQAMGSTLGAWVFAFPPVVWAILAFSVDRNPDITVALHEFAWLSFVTPAFAFPFQTLPIAGVSLFGRKEDAKLAKVLFPRWFGYFSLWALVAGETGMAALLFKTGPFAWNGALAFYFPLIVFSAWESTLLFLMLKAIKHQEAEDASPV